MRKIQVRPIAEPDMGLGGTSYLNFARAGATTRASQVAFNEPVRPPSTSQ